MMTKNVLTTGLLKQHEFSSLVVHAVLVYVYLSPHGSRDEACAIKVSLVVRAWNENSEVVQPPGRRIYPEREMESVGSLAESPLPCLTLTPGNFS